MYVVKGWCFLILVITCITNCSGSFNRRSIKYEAIGRYFLKSCELPILHGVAITNSLARIKEATILTRFF